MGVPDALQIRQSHPRWIRVGRANCFRETPRPPRKTSGGDSQPEHNDDMAINILGNLGAEDKEGLAIGIANSNSD